MCFIWKYRGKGEFLLGNRGWGGQLSEQLASPSLETIGYFLLNALETLSLVDSKVATNS